MMVGLIQRISNWIATLTEEDVRSALEFQAAITAQRTSCAPMS